MSKYFVNGIGWVSNDLPKYQNEIWDMKYMKKLYTYENSRGLTLIAAMNDEDAKILALRDSGPGDAPRNIREATEDDIAWVKAMGGRVPDV